MIIQTKKHQLSKKKYIGLAFWYTWLSHWWITLLFTLAAGTWVYYAPSWWVTVLPFLYLFYLLLLLLQFYAVTTLEQNTLFFARLSYQISSRQLLIQISSKQGMPIDWSQIKWVKQQRKAILLFLSNAQFIYLPHRIFHSPYEISFLKTLLKRRNILR